MFLNPPDRPEPMSKILSTVIMWLAWLFMILLAVLSGHYLTIHISRLNNFSRPFDVLATGMFLLPILICGVLRFWLSRIRNPWLALLPFLFGLYFAWQAGMYGIYILQDFCILYQILSGILLAIYLPLFIRFPATPPPLPTTGNSASPEHLSP